MSFVRLSEPSLGFYIRFYLVLKWYEYFFYSFALKKNTLLLRENAKNARAYYEKSFIAKKCENHERCEKSISFEDVASGKA